MAIKHLAIALTFVIFAMSCQADSLAGEQFLALGPQDRTQLFDLTGSSATIGCVHVDITETGAVYELTALKVDTSDYTVDVTSTTKAKETSWTTNSTYTIDFNICTDTVNKCANPNDNPSYGVFNDITYTTVNKTNTTDNSTYPVVENTTVCTAVAKASDADLKKDDDDVEYQVLTPGNSQSGIRIVFNEGTDEAQQVKTRGGKADKSTVCPDCTYSFELELKCDDSIAASDDQSKKIQNMTSRIEINQTAMTYKYIVSGATRYSCPTVDIQFLMDFIKDNKIFFIIGLGVLGLFLCLFGKAFIRVTLFLSGLILVTGALMGLSFAFFVKSDTQDSLKYTLLGVSALLGMLVGYGLSRKEFQKFAFFCVGALLGVFGGSILMTFLITLNLDFVNDHYDAAMWIVFIVCGAIAGLIALVIEDVVQILATSFFGSFAVFWSVGLALDNYPSYADLKNYVQNPEQYGTIPLTTWVYLGGTVVLGIVGIVFQCYRHNKNKEKQISDKDSEMYNQGMAYQNTQNFGNHNYGAMH